MVSYLREWADYADCCLLVGADPSKLDFVLTHPLLCAGEVVRRVTATSRRRFWLWLDYRLRVALAATSRRIYRSATLGTVVQTMGLR